MPAHETKRGGMDSKPWWSSAVFYQVYPRSFADSNGDGVGDLDGLTARLGHLEQLGVDAIWLNPVTVSPMADHGYDVADPRDIDPLFGGMAAIERLIAAAHQRGMKITMDVVPNHTSSAHLWFQAALAAGPGTDARGRYLFRDGGGADGELPPNNWSSRTLGAPCCFSQWASSIKCAASIPRGRAPVVLIICSNSHVLSSFQASP